MKVIVPVEIDIQFAEDFEEDFRPTDLLKRALWSIEERMKYINSSSAYYQFHGGKVLKEQITFNGEPLPLRDMEMSCPITQTHI